MVMAVWLPITWQHTIANASAWVGFTLPGIIEDPGSFAGSDNSPKPQRGPEPNQRTSLAIFIKLTANVFSDPDAATTASWAASCANLFGAETKGSPVFSAIDAATETLFGPQNER